MYYCDKKCQKTDWKGSHRNECKLFASFGQILNRDCDRFLLRLWLLIKSDESLQTITHELYNGFKRSFNDLLTHSIEIREDITRIKCFNDICDRFRSCDLEFDFKQMFELFSKICINSFSILNEDLNEIGSGLYIRGSVLNHSCRPNAAIIFNGIDLELRAIKPIDSNEEVFINYIDPKSSRQERREKLRQQYYFDCHCFKCSLNSDELIDYSLVKSLDKQMDELITNQSDWQKCYSIGMQSISLYNQIYGDFHPDLTVQLMRVLKVKALIVEKENVGQNEFKDLIIRTQMAIKITHGFGHKIYQLFLDMIGI